MRSKPQASRFDTKPRALKKRPVLRCRPLRLLHAGPSAEQPGRDGKQGLLSLLLLTVRQDSRPAECERGQQLVVSG